MKFSIYLNRRVFIMLIKNRHIIVQFYFYFPWARRAHSGVLENRMTLKPMLVRMCMWVDGWWWVGDGGKCSRANYIDVTEEPGLKPRH